MTNKINIPKVSQKLDDKKITLPFNGKIVSEKGFSFSFACFDRTEKLFNLGDNTSDGVVSGKWFLDLLDCLKNINNMTIPEMRASMYRLHPVDWGKTNAKAPLYSEQNEYWQFRINKSRGRVIGFIIDGVFYVVWLDPHHNLTDSDIYGGVNMYKAGMSEYETMKQYICQLEEALAAYQNGQI